MPPPAAEDLTAGAVVLPPLLARVAEAENSRWLVLKVDPKLDWRVALDGARLKLGQAVGLRTKGSEEPLVAFVHEGNEASQLLPLKPTTPGSNKLTVAGRVEGLVRIVKGVHDDANAGATDVESRANVNTDDEGFVHLKTVPPNEHQRFNVPLAFWQPGPFNWGEDGGATMLRFKCFASAKLAKIGNTKLVGQFEDAPLLRLVGQRVRQPKHLPALRVLLGGQLAGSCKMHMCEAELYRVNRDPGEIIGVTEESDPTKKGALDYAAALSDYNEKRKALVQGFGAAKALRVHNIMAKKREDVEVADLEENMEELRERATLVESSVVPLKEQQLVVRRKYLPPFDLDTSEPSLIYAKGLDIIAPEDLVKKEHLLVDEQIVELLQMDPGQVMNLPRPTLRERSGGTPFVFAVLLANAVNNVPRKSEAAAREVAAQLGVLHCLFNLFKHFRRHTCVRAHDVARVTELPTANRSLVEHWFKTYCDEIPSRRFQRSLESRRLLCHMVVYALHLTQNFGLTYYSDNTDNFGLKTEKAREIFEFVGCSCKVETDAGSTGGRVIAKLQAPLNTDDIQRSHT